MRLESNLSKLQDRNHIYPTSKQQITTKIKLNNKVLEMHNNNNNIKST